MACLLFDLDGTLVHSAPDICAVANRALARVSAPPLALDTITAMIGQGLEALFVRALDAVDRRLTAPELERAVAQMFADYQSSPAPLTRPYPQVPEVLEALSAAGHHLALCTNKDEDLACALLEALDLRRFFPVVIGRVEGRPRKPDAWPLRTAAARLGCSLAHAVMIGDTAADRIAARAAGIPCILVTFGYHQGCLEELAAEQTISAFAALPAALKALEEAAKPGLA